MTKAEKLFQQIAQKTPHAVTGKMFGAQCIKAENGKTAAFLWQESMQFKLAKDVQLAALKIKGASMASHLYAPEKTLSGWISIPEAQAGEWLYFAEKAIKYVAKLK